MAKNFPYFKFTSSLWLTGDIVFEDLETQGLFINICALFWQRDGEITIQDVEKRFSSSVDKAKLSDRLAKLSDRFIYVDQENNGKISIKFLDEQLLEISEISEKNSKNGQKGGLAKSLKDSKQKDKKSEPKRPLSDRQATAKQEEKKREEEEKKRKDSLLKEKFFQTSINDEVWTELLKMACNINYPKEWITKFQTYSLSVEETYATLSDYRGHCTRWIKSEIEKKSKSPQIQTIGRSLRKA